MAKTTSTPETAAPSAKELQKQLKDAERTISGLQKSLDKAEASLQKANDKAKAELQKAVVSSSNHASKLTCTKLVEQIAELGLEPKVQKLVEKTIKSFRYGSTEA